MGRPCISIRSTPSDSTSAFTVGSTRSISPALTAHADGQVAAQQERQSPNIRDCVSPGSRRQGGTYPVRQLLVVGHHSSMAVTLWRGTGPARGQPAGFPLGSRP